MLDVGDESCVLRALYELWRKLRRYARVFGVALEDAAVSRIAVNVDVRTSEHHIHVERIAFLCNRVGGMIPSPEEVLQKIVDVQGGIN